MFIIGRISHTMNRILPSTYRPRGPQAAPTLSKHARRAYFTRRKPYFTCIVDTYFTWREPYFTWREPYFTLQKPPAREFRGQAVFV